MKKEKLHCWSLVWVTGALLILFTNFQQLKEDAAWWLYFASFVLANNCLAFALTDEDFNKQRSIRVSFHWLIAIASIAVVLILLWTSHYLAIFLYDKPMPLNFSLVLSWLLVILGNALIYYSVIVPKKIPSYTPEWARKNIKRDLNIGITTVLYSAPMFLLMIVISVYIKQTDFYPPLWQSLLWFIATSVGAYIVTQSP